MNSLEKVQDTTFPYLMTRAQASSFLGIDPKSFDKYVRSNPQLKRFMIGRQERYIKSELIFFIQSYLTKE